MTRRNLSLLAILGAALVAPMPVPAASSSSWYMPPVRGPVVRHFEPPPTPYAAGHRGIDIATARLSTVLASAAGTVAFAGQVGGQLFVSVDHPDGIRTTYSFLDVVVVRAGQRVSQGEVVARSGAGHAGSASPHLHFGMRVGSAYLDPEPYLVAGFRRDYSKLVRLVPVPAR